MATDTEYLPEPPESVEVGPNSDAPSSDYAWIPGCWVRSYGRYAWRPGYWAVMQPDWIWVPAHYVWTPRGYIFVGGYWDLAVNHRGVLFAPVFFSLGAMAPGFYFTPSYMIDLGVFSDFLFLRPRYHHYYFGDYYAPKYYRKGIYPWFSPMRSVIATTPFMPINVGSIVMIAPGRIVYRQHIRNAANTWRPDRREGCMMQENPGLR